MAVKIQIRRGTAAAWTSANSILADGELGIETDTRKIKIGNGTTAWNTLPYAVSGGGSGNVAIRTNYDASTNLYPDPTVSPFPQGGGIGGAIQKGDQFPLSVGGTLGGTPYPAGTILLALADNPGQTDANWRPW